MKTAEEIRKMVRSAYSDIAEQSRETNAASCCGAGSCSTTDFMLQGENYSAMEGYNADADLGLGCGIPTQFSRIEPGDTILDLGSGAGNDVFIARAQTGPGGRVIGVDMTPAMIEKARANNAKLGYENVEFRLGEIEHLPVAADAVNVIVSNCVLNLVPDKARAFSEMFRVLVPGGRFTVSDIVLEGQLPQELRQAAEMYAGCVSGAMRKDEYLEAARQAGFVNIDVVKEKKIEIPPEILANYLSAEEMRAYGESTAAILSVTVSAEKPADMACCGGGCC